MQSIQTTPPKLCATRSTKHIVHSTAQHRQKRKKKREKRRSRQQRANRRQRESERNKKTRIVADAVCYGCTSPSISHINLFLQSNHCSLSTKASHFSLVLRYFFFFFHFVLYLRYTFMFVCMCVYADSSFCYFQTRISFRYTICIFEHCMLQCQAVLLNLLPQHYI